MKNASIATSGIPGLWTSSTAPRISTPPNAPKDPSHPTRIHNVRELIDRLDRQFPNRVHDVIDSSDDQKVGSVTGQEGFRRAMIGTDRAKLERDSPADNAASRTAGRRGVHRPAHRRRAGHLTSGEAFDPERPDAVERDFAVVEHRHADHHVPALLAPRDVVVPGAEQ